MSVLWQRGDGMIVKFYQLDGLMVIEQDCID
jgi:hypothetical protein